MGELAKAIRAMTITGMSPGGMVRVRMGAESGTRITLTGRGVGAITEADLAAEVEAVWRRALTTARKAKIEAQEKIYGPSPARPIDPLVREQRQRRQAAMAAITVGATSESGVVTARRRGSTDVQVFIRAGALQFMDNTELEADVNAAIAEVNLLRAKRRAQVVEELLAADSERPDRRPIR